MKKFEPRISVDGTSMEAVMVESPNIIPHLEYYVPADLAEEMLEVLKEAHNEILAMHIIYEGRNGSDDPLLQQIKSIIAKAEEV